MMTTVRIWKLLEATTFAILGSNSFHFNMKYTVYLPNKYLALSSLSHLGSDDVAVTVRTTKLC